MKNHQQVPEVYGRTRRHVVLDLYARGFSTEQVSDMSGLKHGYVVRVLRALGKESFPSRPKEDEDIFSSVVLRYAECTRNLTDPRASMVSEAEGALHWILAQWLKEENILAFIQGVEGTMSYLCRHTTTESDDVYNPRVVWHEWLLGILREGALVPQSSHQLHTLLVEYMVGVARKDVQPLLFEGVDSLDLSMRTAKCLESLNIVFVGDLVQKTEDQLLRGQNFGRKLLKEVKRVLAERGLRFNMSLPEGIVAMLEEKRIRNRALSHSARTRATHPSLG